MLSEKLISFFKEKKWWFDEASQDYKKFLEKLNIEMSSDFIKFYLHVENSTTFVSKNGEIYQLGWFLTNTDLVDNLFSINDSLKISHDFILLNAFEGESGFLFNINNGNVIFYKLGDDIEHPSTIWSNFNEFLICFFDI